MASLHSIPSRLKVWDYLFFIEIGSPYPSPKIKKTIKDLEKYCSVARVVGAS